MDRPSRVRRVKGMDASSRMASLAGSIPLRRIDGELWEVPASARADMRVPARVFANRAILEAIAADRSLEQLQNVATLPGIVEAAMAMPDIHQGYGFPVGGLAAFDIGDGVVSPGGVGYDINCGVRLLALPLNEDELGARRQDLVHQISRSVPAGAGRAGALNLSTSQLDRVLREGSAALVAEHGIGTDEDVERTESRGRLPSAAPALVSRRAHRRGSGQLGTLGSGNHFVELQRVEAVFDDESASAFGVREGQVAVLIHSGSRGLGHQVCTDYVRRMDASLASYGIRLPDRQLACAPLSSDEAREYLGAMAAAANYAWANRQAIAHSIRKSIRMVLGELPASDTRQVYDVAHNVAKRERYGGRELCVHRKGATRAFPPGSPDIPIEYREAGQPVFIPGSMGTASFILAGRHGSIERSFGTVCHGAGRRLSRTGARKRVTGAELRRELESRGITVRCSSNRGLAEEAPFAYKDVDEVVQVVERAGLAARVARLRPLGVVKG
jgi:tRNA-splicing ligase RtcB (3'-phosphate/5'-hydroxy nucleic acid ligase)